MLGKLLYHEWKNTWKLMALINGTVLILSMLGVIFAAMGNVTDFFTRNGVGNAWTFLLYMSFIMVYVLGILASSVGTSLYFYIRFYRNMYTDQGYLMHTLPVSEHALILSKAFVAIIWRIIGMIITALGILSILAVFLNSMTRNADIILPDLPTIYDTLLNEMFDGNAFYLFSYILMYIILGIGSIFYSIFMGYGAISLGQLAVKNKVLASVGCYFGIHILVSMISNLLSQTYMMVAVRTIDTDKGFGPGGFHALSIGMTLIMSIGVYALAIVFYFLTHQIMQKKLNLD